MTLYAAHANNVAHTGSSADKTVLQLITTSTDRIRIVEWGVLFDGVSSSAVPVEVRLQRQTSAGTTPVALATNYDVIALDPASPTASVTAKKGIWAAEPTMSGIIWAGKVSPTSGLVIQKPLGQEPVIAVSSFVGIVVNAAAAVNAWAYIIWDE